MSTASTPSTQPTTLRPRPASRRVKIIALAATLAALGAGWTAITPSNDRDWRPDQRVLPRAEIRGTRVRVHDVRNFRYRTPERFTAAYETRDYDLDRLTTVWFGIAPFADWRGPAHTFLSFGFDDGRYLAISVEARKEVGESYSVLGGMLKRYELTYVIGDERDVIALRTNYYRDDVYLYPVRATAERKRALLLSMLARANRLRDRPEFYNTLTSNCTTNIVRHVNVLAPGRIPLSLKVLLPGYSDELAHELGLLDTDLPLAAAREKFRITGRARAYGDGPEFSRVIRQY